MHLHDVQTRHDKVPPELAGLQVAQDAEQDEHTTAGNVVDRGLLHAGEDEVASRGAAAPLQAFEAETIVGETFRWIDKSVAGEFEVDVDGFDLALVGSCCFVGVVLNRSVFSSV